MPRVVPLYELLDSRCPVRPMLGQYCRTQVARRGVESRLERRVMQCPREICSRCSLYVQVVARSVLAALAHAFADGAKQEFAQASDLDAQLQQLRT